MRAPQRWLILIAGLAFALGACSGSTGQATAGPSVNASPAAAATPSDAATPAETAMPAVSASQAAALHLSGGLLYSRFTEVSHTFTGMFVSRSDGSGEVAVPLPWTEGGGRWSRSGTQIAVATQLPDGRVGTAIIGADGAVDRVLQIPDPTLNLVCTVWSRDDSRLACEAWDDAHPDRGGVYTVRASDGTDMQRLTTAPDGMIDEVGDYSPAGPLVFRRGPAPEGDGPLLVVDASGGRARPLSPTAMENTGRFSPDGSLILTATQGHIVIMDLSGKVVHRITTPNAYLFGPAWSPDGSRIAYSRSDSGPFAEVYTSLPDGTDDHRVTTTADNEIGIDWAAEGG